MKGLCTGKGLAGAAQPFVFVLLGHAAQLWADWWLAAGGQRARARADGGGELCSAQPGQHSARAAQASGDHARVPASHVPRRLYDRRSQTAQHAHPGRVLHPSCLHVLFSLASASSRHTSTCHSPAGFHNSGMSLSLHEPHVVRATCPSGQSIHLSIERLRSSALGTRH